MSSKTPSGPDGYFGFCLDDSQFPIIYVNNSSTKTRQIFTLFHELGHLIFQTSGIDRIDDQILPQLTNYNRKIEITCNGLAACILVQKMSLIVSLRVCRLIETRQQNLPSILRLAVK
ncbi:MAG: ImmA/IrrE family metallo-endopeptidase [Candidatus Competibacteraceae bacterium]